MATVYISTSESGLKVEVHTDDGFDFDAIEEEESDGEG